MNMTTSPPTLQALEPVPATVDGEPIPWQDEWWDLLPAFPVEAAKKGYRNTSWAVDERVSGDVAAWTESVVSTWEECAKVALTPESKDRLLSWFVTFVSGYCQRVSEYYRHIAHVAHPGVVGPSRMGAEINARRRERALQASRAVEGYVHSGVLRFCSSVQADLPLDIQRARELERTLEFIAAKLADVRSLEAGTQRPFNRVQYAGQIMRAIKRLRSWDDQCACFQAIRETYGDSLFHVATDASWRKYLREVI